MALTEAEEAQMRLEYERLASDFNALHDLYQQQKRELIRMRDVFVPKHEKLVGEVANIRGELELANVQRTLLSGAMQENARLEQQNARMRALLEQIDTEVQQRAAQGGRMSWAEVALLTDPIRAFLLGEEVTHDGKTGS